MSHKEMFYSSSVRSVCVQQQKHCKWSHACIPASWHVSISRVFGAFTQIVLTTPPSFVLRWRRFLTFSSALTHKVVTLGSWFSVFICGPNINQPSPDLTTVVLPTVRHMSKCDVAAEDTVQWVTFCFKTRIWHLIPLPENDKFCDFKLKISDSVICWFFTHLMTKTLELYGSNGP